MKHDEVVYIHIRKEIICQARVPKPMNLNANTHTFETHLSKIVYSHTHKLIPDALFAISLSGWCEVLRVPARAQVGLFIAIGTGWFILSACLICTHSPGRHLVMPHASEHLETDSSLIPGAMTAYTMPLAHKLAFFRHLLYNMPFSSQGLLMRQHLVSWCLSINSNCHTSLRTCVFDT